MDVEVIIEGVSEARLAHEIQQEIRHVFSTVTRDGDWCVSVSPSETRGQWDLGVRGPVNHFSSFTEPVERLPRLVAERLRACL